MQGVRKIIRLQLILPAIKNAACKLRSFKKGDVKQIKY